MATSTRRQCWNEIEMFGGALLKVLYSTFADHRTAPPVLPRAEVTSRLRYSVTTDAVHLHMNTSRINGLIVMSRRMLPSKTVRARICDCRTVCSVKDISRMEDSYRYQMQLHFALQPISGQCCEVVSTSQDGQVYSGERKGRANILSSPFALLGQIMKTPNS